MRRLIPSTLRSNSVKRMGPCAAATMISTLHFPATLSRTSRTGHAVAHRHGIPAGADRDRGADARRTIARFGPYRVLLAGLALITAGMALLSRAPLDGRYVADVLPPLLLLAAGFAAAMPAVTGLAMSGAREEDAGLASGLFNTTQVVGGSLGLAVLTTLAASRTQRLIGGGEHAVAATADGYRLAFTVATGIAAAALLLAAALLRPGRAVTAPAPQAGRQSRANASL
jgi:MFS family permease